MIQYIYADAFDDQPRLRDTMFKDRATQFRDRLKWEVDVDEHGHERDQYDAEIPLYLVATTPDGLHAGSMRFLPTTGRTMVHEHFLHLTDGVRIESPFIWECTRFCISPKAPKDTAAKLMLGAAEMGLASGLSHAIGVFDARMVTIYRRLGWSPAILGTSGEGSQAISVGLWAFTPDVLPKLRAIAGVSAAASESWMPRAFGPRLVA